MGGRGWVPLWLLVAALLGAAGGPGAAEPALSVTESWYMVGGTTPRALRQEMRRKGPKGYWAYTRWRVRWNRYCKVRVSIAYTFPRLERPESVPLPVRRKWDRMLERLIAHERRHGAHGIAAAREVEAAGCRGADAIVRKWSRRTKRLDVETRHGRTEGVLLPD